MFVPSVLCALMFFLPAGELPENPWKDRVTSAVERAAARATPAALAEALDVTWRADDWRPGLKLARRGIEQWPNNVELRALAVRALWRAGLVIEAEQLATSLTTPTKDRVALRSLMTIHLCRGDFQQADQLAGQLEQLKPLTAQDLCQIADVRFALNKLTNLTTGLRAAERLIDAREGYPETHLGEAIEGVAKFLDTVGDEPLNQISAYGSVSMSPLALLNLPACDVMINGNGPYKMIMDTGGSIMVALDQEVADEIGLKSVAEASVRGVSGKQVTGQALIDELSIGSIECRRVVTRTFDVRSAVMGAADGIIGTGIFAQGRMTMDFAGTQLTLSRSGDQPAAGVATDLRLVADSKMIVPLTLEGRPAVALLDTGADAVVVSTSLLDELFPDRKILKIDADIGLGIGSGQAPQVALSSGVDFEFAGRKYEDYGGLGLDVLDQTLSPIIGTQIDLLIGMPAFREMRTLTVDFPKCKLWVEWLKRD